MLPNSTKFPTGHACFVSLIVCLVLSVAVTAHAQAGGTDMTGTGGRHTISGRLIFPSGQRADVRLKVRLESFGSGDLTVISDINGNFSFRSLKPGSYTVVIEGGESFESERETVFIEPASITGRRSVGTVPISRPFAVQIYLRAKVDPATGKPGVVNAALATIPKPAAEHYRQALDYSAKGQTDKAILELQQALLVHPNFALALNELGVQYLKSGQPQKAIDSLRAALRIQPEDFVPRLNYGIALVEAKNPAEAEVQLRLALGKNDGSWAAHMYLGVAMIGLRKLDEAETELLRAAQIGGPRLGLPHYWLGGIYWHKRQYSRAATELEKFLEITPNAPNAERVRGTIKELRAKQSNPPEKP
jgi:tetratricopeptide (TPR) repeat protein